MDTSEIMRVIVQIRAPRGTDLGEAAEAHYRVDANRIVLTDEHGKLLRRPLNGELYEYRVASTDNAQALAGKLCSERYWSERGLETETARAFNRPLIYGPRGVV